jgi:co-chaperonin GroES (HSP10)
MIVPRHDRVLVEPASEELGQVQRETQTGLVVVENATHKLPPTTTGTVIDVGEEVDDLDPGDAVVFARYAGTIVLDGEQALSILRDSEIIAIIDDEDN